MKNDTLTPTYRGLKLKHMVDAIRGSRPWAARHTSYPWGACRTTLKESVDCSYMFVGDTYFKRENNNV